MVISGLFVLVVLLLGPPLLVLLSALRRVHRRRARSDEPRTWMPMLGLAGAALAVLLVNIVILATTRLPAPGAFSFDMTRAHGLGALLSWLLFWVWIILPSGKPHQRSRRRAA
ncbi:MAG: hypothetical protein RLZZ528_2039 [Pseudomonadota bacterium]|jgi:hypothetical protein